MTDKATNITVVDIIGFLDERLAHFDNVHGDLLSIFGEGVLIAGKSGIGKSEIALDLISRGHVLVADDRVDCYRIHTEITGTAPEVLKHYLELRGVGVIDVMRLYGARAYLDSINIGLVINLEHFEHADAFERLDSKEDFETIMGVQIPKITIPVTEGRNMSVIIESAVINFNLKQLGTDSFQEFRQRVLENIERNK